MDGSIKWVRIEDWSDEKGERKVYITDGNERSSWEWQGILTYCTYQWNEWMNVIRLLFWLFIHLDPKLSTVFLIVVPQMCYIRVNWKMSSKGM
jgi:hypothetical protein